MNDLNSWEKSKLKFRQKLLLLFYKTYARVSIYLQNLKIKVIYFLKSLYFHLLLACWIVYFINYVLKKWNIAISDDKLFDLAMVIAGIIGASIAIIFSFSTFILQSTAELFSTQYLNKFIESKIEKNSFWLLVFFTILASIIPFLFENYVLELLILILLCAFYLIYRVYKDLRTRINPETTLKIIKNNALKQLNEVYKILNREAKAQSFIFDYSGYQKQYVLDAVYKNNSNRNLTILENIKMLYEIWLRLLWKNEINSFNLTLYYIYEIYYKHLQLRDQKFTRTPIDFRWTTDFNDEWFTTTILEYFQSIWYRLISDKRKENIYYLLQNIYPKLIQLWLNISYADNESVEIRWNPLLSLIVHYYIWFIEKIIISEESDRIRESIKSLSIISHIMLKKGTNNLVMNPINDILWKLSIYCASKSKEVFVKEIIEIYINQIKISWNKYAHDDFFWKTIFEKLRENILFISAISKFNLSLTDLFIGFDTWHLTVVQEILKLEKWDQQNIYLDDYLIFIERWSDFLLDFSRGHGLNNQLIGIHIIQSIENNLRAVYFIKHNSNKDPQEIYRTQFHTLSRYFQNTETVDESFLFNLNKVLEVLAKEIFSNLKEELFKIDEPFTLYIRLIEQHFAKCTSGHRYNHPRVIKKLVPLGLILEKHQQHEKIENVINKIDELNKKYLEMNKDFFDMKSKKPNLMWPDEFQLCEELHDFENEIFSYSNHWLDTTINLLRNEVTREIRDSFTQKIVHCRNIKYTTNVL